MTNKEIDNFVKTRMNNILFVTKNYILLQQKAIIVNWQDKNAISSLTTKMV